MDDPAVPDFRSETCGHGAGLFLFFFFFLFFLRFFFSSVCLSEAVVSSRGGTSRYYSLTGSTSFFLCYNIRGKIADPGEAVTNCTRGLDLLQQADHPQPGSGCLNGEYKASTKIVSLSKPVINGVFCRITWHYVWRRVSDIGASVQNNSLQCEYFSLLMMNCSGLEQSVVRTGLWPVSWAGVANRIV